MLESEGSAKPNSMAVKGNSAVMCSTDNNASPRGRWWWMLGRCGGCLTHTSTLRLLATLALVFGVVISISEGMLVVREEQKYQRCLLHQAGLVGDRHLSLSTNEYSESLSTCYSNDINLVRGFGGAGVVVTIVYLMVSLLLLVAVSMECWHLCIPWVCVSILIGVYEVLQVSLCWSLLSAGDLLLFTLHCLVLGYSLLVFASVLHQLDYLDFRNKRWCSR
nr:uncharacterized protein LOC128706490 [Cherax quadricarinatus]